MRQLSETKVKMMEVEPTFIKIVDGLLGAEGPVFDQDGNFYMVAPEVTKNESFAGQVYSIDLKDRKVQIKLFILS